MKKYNQWKKINEEQETQTQTQPSEKMFLTTDGTNMSMTEVINMLAQSVSSDEKSIQGTANIDVGKMYLYTNKKGETYPVKILSMDHTMKNIIGQKFEPGKVQDDAQELDKGNITAQYTNTKEGPEGIIGGIKSSSIALLKDKLKELPDNYNWTENQLDTLLKSYSEEKSEKVKKMIGLYIANKLKNTDVSKLKKYLNDEKYKDFKNIINDIINKNNNQTQQTQKVEKEPQKVQTQQTQQTQKVEQEPQKVQTQNTQNVQQKKSDF